MTEKAELQSTLVRKLREQSEFMKRGVASWQLMARAAEEIERLQRERDSIELELIAMAEKVERLTCDAK